MDEHSAFLHEREKTLGQQALQFGHAVVRHAANGFATLDDLAYEARLTVCRQCERCDIERMLCRECGCLLVMKARWGSEGCPRGKWDEIDRAPVT